MGGFYGIRSPEFIEKQRESEKQKERPKQEVQRLQQQAHQFDWDAWFARRFTEELTIENKNPAIKEILRAIGEFVAERGHNLRKDYEAKFAAQDARIKELEQKLALGQQFADLEQRLDARQIARDEAKRGSEMIPQGAVLAKIEKLQRQADDLERVADLDARFRELAGRVGELEKTNSLEARFTKLANEAKGGPEVPLLAKIEMLQHQIDDLMSVDARKLAERIGELEKINSLEARFTKLANEAKGGPEIPQSELLANIEEQQRQIGDLNKVSAQPGPQGPPGPPGKLPRVKEYAAGRVHYEADVVVHAGALWQASSDTVHAPPHSDWICIARAGRDGSDGRTPNVCGPYDAREKYERLDIVALDGAAFIARRDDPGICPGDGWQLVSRQG